MAKRDCDHVCYKALDNSKLRKDTKCEEVGQMNGKRQTEKEAKPQKVANFGK